MNIIFLTLFFITHTICYSGANVKPHITTLPSNTLSYKQAKFNILAFLALKKLEDCTSPQTQQEVLYELHAISFDATRGDQNPYVFNQLLKKYKGIVHLQKDAQQVAEIKDCYPENDSFTKKSVNQLHNTQSQAIANVHDLYHEQIFNCIWFILNSTKKSCGEKLNELKKLDFSGYQKLTKKLS